MKTFNPIFFALLLFTFFACEEKHAFDASGTFEAVETIISAEAAGKIMSFELTEGQSLQAGQVVGYIDSTQLYLKKLQLEQNKKAILSGRPQTQIQIKALKEQLATAKTDRDRLQNLVKGGVATQKQLDDAQARVTTLEAQIKAQQSTLYTTTSTINEQGSLVDIQLQELNDQLEKYKIRNPISGTVLSKYAEAYEMTGPGKPLYKIADLSSLKLRAYITADLFAKIKLGQKVKVLTDDGNGGFKETQGSISWISDKAEFTPKSVLTKSERANLVYAIKVDIINDGSYKIGMYGEVLFN